MSGPLACQHLSEFIAGLLKFQATSNRSIGTDF